MTESDWLTSTDPQAMLSLQRDRGVSERTFLHYACAVSRWLGSGVADTSHKGLMDAVEQEVEVGTLEGCYGRLTEYRSELIGRFYDRPRPDAPRLVSVGSPVAPTTPVCLVMAMMVVNELRAGRYGVVVESRFRAEDLVDYGAVLYRFIPLPEPALSLYHHAGAVRILRDIFGNPFRPVPFSLDRRTEAVVGLSRVIYEEQAFERMPVLADALEDAGCDSAEALEHCRGPNVHVRGCWVVDSVLGRE